MNDTAPQRRPFQYSLWSLFVLSTVVAVLCSLGVCTHWSVPVGIVAGVGISVIGIRLLSLRKLSAAGVLCAVVGLLVMAVGLAIISYVVLAVGLEVMLRLWPQ